MKGDPEPPAQDVPAQILQACEFGARAFSREAFIRRAIGGSDDQGTRASSVISELT